MKRCLSDARTRRPLLTLFLSVLYLLGAFVVMRASAARPASYAIAPSAVSHSAVAGYSLPQYTLQDLGEIDSVSEGLGMNDAGDVIGEEYSGGFQGFFTSPTSTVTGLGFLSGGSDTEVGYFGTYSDSEFGIGFLGNTPGDYSRLDNAINISGEVTGEAYTSSDAYQAFVWSLSGGLTGIGTLSEYPAGNSYGAAINSDGQIAGGADYQTSNDIPISHAFAWTPSSAGASTGTFGDLGVIADSGDDNGPPETGGAVPAEKSRETPSISRYGPYSLGSFAYGINDAGQIVGTADAGNEYSHAFLYVNSLMTDLGSLAADASSTALGINGMGDIFGYSGVDTITSGYSDGGGHAFLWEPDSPNSTDGAMTDIGTLSTDYDYGSTPYAMNSSGEVVGIASVNGINPATQIPPVFNDGTYQYNYAPYGHAFAYAPQTDDSAPSMQDIGSLYCGDGTSSSPYNDASYYFDSVATDINASGTAVGISYGGEYGEGYAAFVYTGGFMYNLNDLLTGSNITGWTLTDAYSINTSGQIACYATGPDGNEHVVLLTPTTPSTSAPNPVLPGDQVYGTEIQNNLFPQNALAGGPQFTLAINGSGFTQDALVVFNGDTLAAVDVESDSLILATVPSSEIANAGNYYVSVVNPENDAYSVPETFSVLPAALNPTLTSLNPDTQVAGSAAFNMTVYGSNLDSTSVVNFNGYTLTPSSVAPDGTSLVVSVPAYVVYDPAGLNVSYGYYTHTIVPGATYAVSVTNYPNSTDQYASENYPVTSNSLSFTVTNPPVTISNISPAQVPEGATGEYITITGTGFNDSTQITWQNPNDTGETGPAVYYTESSTQLLFEVQSYETTNSATIPITVTNPSVLADGSDGGSANTTFTVGNPSPPPAITSLSPSSGQADSYNGYLTIQGSNMVSGATVSFGSDTDIASDTVSTDGTSLTVTIPGTDLTNPGPESVTVTNPAGGGTSNSLTFTVDNPDPFISQITPSSALAGSGGFLLTVGGSGFATGSTVAFGGDSPITPLTISPTSIEVSIPAADIASAGTPDVTVTNPNPNNDPGFFTSNAVPFTITAPIAVSVLAVSPTTVTATQSSEGTVTLSQAAPDGGAVVTLQSDNAEADVPPTVTVLANATTAQFPITTNAIDSTTQVANIGASYGNVTQTAQLTINPYIPPAPQAPTGLTATAVSGIEIDLSWTGSTGASGYSVERSTAGGSYQTVVADIAGTSYADIGLTPDTTYSYIVTAENTGGTSGNDGPVSATTLPSPITLTATPGNAVVNLSWTTLPTIGETYNLYRGLEPGAETPYANNVTGTTYTDTGVENGVTYYYELVAVSPSGQDTYSNQTSATPIDAADPDPASDLQLAVSTVSSWVGHTSQFTVTLTNTGGAPQYLTSASVAPQGTVGAGWVALDAKLPTAPLAAGSSAQATFDLVVPAGATGGTATDPVEVPLILTVDGNATYTRNFDLDLYASPPTYLQVTVDDTNGNPIPNALLAFDNDANVYGTDSNGEVTLPEAPGSDIVYAYQSGYLPNQQSVDIVEGTTNTVLIQLTKGDPLNVTSFTVTPISGAQAAALGIDLDDEENYSVYEFTLNIGVLTQTGYGAFRNTTPTTPANGGGSGNGGWVNIYGLDGSYLGQAMTPGPGQYVVVWLSIPGEVKYLKQFFAASAVILNDTPYTIGDVDAEIDLPSGLELPDLNGEEQPEKQTIGDLKAGASTSAEWIIRGDDPGTYAIGGDLNGSLELGGAQIPTHSDLAGAVTVQAPTLSLSFTKPGAVQAGTPFNLGINITNTSSIDLDGASIDLTSSDLVNCSLPSDQEEEQELGTIPAGATVTANYQIIPEVSGNVVAIQNYVTNNPAQMPPVKIQAFLLEAANESVSTVAGQPVSIDALKDAVAVAVGEDLGDVKYVAVTPAQNGVAAIDTTSNVLTYTPNPTFAGSDNFGYSITDSKGDVASATVTVDVTPPVVSSLTVNPTSAQVGSGNTDVDLTGNGFYFGSQVFFNNTLLSGVDVNSPTTISAVVPTSLLQSAGNTQFEVYNPGSAAYASFTIGGNPSPFLTNISPNSAPAGSGGLTITATGLGFVASTQIEWNGMPLATTFLNSGYLSAVVPSSDLTAGTANVTVSSPAPGGGTTASLPFTVAQSAPVLGLSLGTIVRNAGNLVVPINITNTGGGNATDVKLGTMVLEYVASGKIVTESALSTTPSTPSTIGPNGTGVATATFAGVSSGATVIIKATVQSDQVASAASFTTKAP